jgi:hypothetical protein
MASEDYKRMQSNQRNAAKAYQRIADLERGAPLNNGGVGESGITVTGGSIRILEGGNLEVDGDASFMGDTNIGGALDVTGATTIGGLLGVSGNATFSGKMRIAGTLELPAGIIGNDALANPLDFYAAGGSAGAFPLSTERTTVTSMVATVPRGFTRAVVQGIGSIYAGNTSANLDYLRARVYVDAPAYSSWGRELLTPMTPNGGSAALTVTRQEVVSRRWAREPITVRLTAQTDFANLPSRSSNGASVDATIIWAR